MNKAQGPNAAHRLNAEKDGLLQQILDTASVAIFLVDLNGMITLANQRMAHMFGRPVKMLQGAAYVDLIHPEEREIGHQTMLALLASEIESVAHDRLYQRADGSLFWGNLTGRRLLDAEGRHLGLVGVIADVDERKRAEATILTLALSDQLTGLSNRRHLFQYLRGTHTDTNTEPYFGALFLLDLDHLKKINDEHGHDIGDLLLRQAGERLRNCVRKTDCIARLGGDEFVVVVSALAQQEAQARARAETLAVKMIKRLNYPYELKSLLYRSTPSIGVTIFKGKVSSPDALIKQADLAMYEAKKAGRNQYYMAD